MPKKGSPNVVSQYQPPRIEVDKLRPNPTTDIASVFKSYKQIEEIHCKSLIYYLYSYILIAITHIL